MKSQIIGKRKAGERGNKIEKKSNTCVENYLA